MSGTPFPGKVNGPVTGYDYFAFLGFFLNPGTYFVGVHNEATGGLMLTANTQGTTQTIPGSYQRVIGGGIEFHNADHAFQVFGDVSVVPLPAAIDIKPGGGPNNINPRSGGFVQVAILTTDALRAEDVDPLTVRFGPLGADTGERLPRLKDVNHDGLIDLLFHFRTQETGIACSDTEAMLTGETFGGQIFEGSDSIKTVGCK